MSCAPLLMLACGAALAGGQSMLLDSSHSLAEQARAQTGDTVQRTLAAGVHVGGEPANVPFQSARIQLGQNYRHGLAPPSVVPESQRVKLDTLEVEDHPLPGIPESRLQADIPFGLASLGWGIGHPNQAARLLLPVTGSQSRPRGPSGAPSAQGAASLPELP